MNWIRGVCGRVLGWSQSAHPDVVHNGSRFAFSSFKIPYEVVPGTEYTPTECEVLIGRTSQAQTRVSSHSDQMKNTERQKSFYCSFV